ncbi:hypothetical protein [Amnibacterium sp.]|uniref:hypothetical protein n=1 Tax=Amnibacterium sp. TaxID=1872496 RepID=UPI00261BD6B1|nr:hypothetical protein [Amnibacterium sp.]
MPRPVVRALIAAAVATGALVAVPQAAFASVPATDTRSGGVHIGALIAPRAVAATTAPRVAATTTRHASAARTSTAVSRSAKPSSSPAPAKAVAPTTGSDVSYPQCSSTPPSNQLFGVVGVNGGTARDFNPCLLPQFTWASKTAGSTPQGTASLYVNTANPGSQSSWWPASDADRPAIDTSAAGPRNALPAEPITYPGGAAPGCSPSVDPHGAACAYVYGYVRAEQAVEYAKETLGPAYSGGLRWWLDVETSNTWAGPTSANAASLAGAATYLGRVGVAADGVARIGVYSSTAQYRTITGGTGSAVPNLPDGERSPLVGLPEWGAGASSLKGAQSNCGVTPFTGGSITLTQFVSGAFDYDVSCRGY